MRTVPDMTEESAPDQTAARFEEVVAPLTAVIDAAPPDAWDRPSPCEDWSARQVVGHLIDTEREFLGRHDVDLGAAPSVEGDPAAAWHQHVDAVRPLVHDPAFVGRDFDGYFGPTTIGETLQRFYFLDLLAHRWDIARAVGGDEAFTGAELDQLEHDIDSYGDVAYTPGVFGPVVEVPDDADRQTRVLARMGRRA